MAMINEMEGYGEPVSVSVVPLGVDDTMIPVLPCQGSIACRRLQSIATHHFNPTSHPLSLLSCFKSLIRREDNNAAGVAGLKEKQRNRGIVKGRYRERERNRIRKQGSDIPAMHVTAASLMINT
jgi:hypothetical protein